ncbi:MAG: oligosaccharide flippase family protein [Melioribacter sp.]|nr:oligosaccharide flippase family protein [Melioribacter sp.]
MGPIVFRESSKEEEGDKLLNSAISIRLVIFISLVVIYNLVVSFLNFSLKEIILSNILFISIILSTRMANLRELLATPFKVHLKMHYPMTLTILDSLLFLILVAIMPFVKGGLYYFVLSYVFSTLPGFIIQFIFLEKKFNFKPQIIFYKAVWLIKESYPLAGFVLLAIVYQQFDVVLLTFYKDEYSAGIYSVATRLTMPLNIIPGVVVTTVFPYLVKNLHDRIKTDSINSLVFKVLFLISFLMAIIFSVRSETIVTLLFGTKFRSASLPSAMIFWSLVFMFFNYFTLDLLTAHSRQIINLVYSLLLVVSNTILNVLLIPEYSYAGVGFSKVIAGFLGFLYLFWALNRNGFALSFINLKFFTWAIFIATAIYLLSMLPLIIYLMASLILILFSLKFFNYFENEELDLIFRLINREKWSRYFRK